MNFDTLTGLIMIEEISHFSKENILMGFMIWSYFEIKITMKACP